MNVLFTMSKKLGAFVSIIIGAVALFEARRLSSFSENLLTGDHVFPGITGFILLVSGCLLFFEKTNENVELPKGIIRRNILFTIALLFAYCFAISILGYFLSTFFVLVFLLKCLGNYRILFSSVLAFIITTALYYLFIVFLKTPLPTLTIPL